MTEETYHKGPGGELIVRAPKEDVFQLQYLKDLKSQHESELARINKLLEEAKKLGIKEAKGKAGGS